MIKNAQAIKEAADMAVVLDSFGIHLDSRGRCSCPIHGGQSKNFSVKDGIATCWSQCGGQTWNAISFIMDYKGFTYPEALEYIASLYQIPVEYSANRHEVIEVSRQEKARKDSLFAINKTVADIYWTNADLNPDMSHNIDNRWFSYESLKAFSVCITPDSNLLSTYDHWQFSDLMELGLVKQGKEDGRYYDCFRNRLLFPILNHQGHIAGFMARKRPTDTRDDIPKYKNSQESLIFKKGELLFGLWQNKRQIREQNCAILVEGMADVVTMHTYGVQNAVASGGTAVTEQQLQLLRRYTDEVLILMDGDDAGRKAATRAVEMAIKAGFKVKIAIFPDPPAGFADKKYDPDNFIRKHQRKGFDIFIEESAQDALLWRVMSDYDDKDIFKREAAINLAGELLSDIKSDTLRDFYIREITAKKNMGSIKSILQDAINKHSDKKRESKSSKLTPAQSNSVIRYGIYEHNKQFFRSNNPDEEGWAISNFIIKPIMLIIGMDRSRRMVEIVNQFGASFIRDIDSDDFVDMSSFKKKVERMGNYTFWETCKPEDFIKIKRKLYDEMHNCYPITTLGWQPRSAFWAWANGITADGQFQPVDEYGIVIHNEVRYFLPAMSKVKTSVMTEEEDSRYEDEVNFIMPKHSPALSLKEWTTSMVEVYGTNGMMAVAFYLAACYRDIIYPKFSSFPLLNLFGPTGSGKSYIAKSLMAMYGKPRNAFHLVHGTDVAFYRLVAKFRNAIVWYDEYSNDVKFQRVEGLKAFFDGTGREKGIASDDNTTTRTRVNSACIVSGQHQPTQDIALFKRCISLNFASAVNDDEAKKRAQRLKDIEATGDLAAITNSLQKYRPIVDKHFDDIFDEMRAVVSGVIAGSVFTEDRILNNHVIPLAVFFVLKEYTDLDFGFKLDELLEATVRNISVQSSSIFNQDELSVWWRMVEFFIEKGDITHEDDIIVQETNSITIKNPEIGSSSKSTTEVNFETSKKVLYMRFTKAYRMYMEQLRREGARQGLNEEALKYYLRISKSFIGEVRAKKFAGQAKSCYAFDLEALGLDIPLTVEVKKKDVEEAPY